MEAMEEEHGKGEWIKARMISEAFAEHCEHDGGPIRTAWEVFAPRRGRIV